MRTKTKVYTIESVYLDDDVIHEANDLSMEVTPFQELIIDEYDNDGEYSETVNKLILN